MREADINAATGSDATVRKESVKIKLLPALGLLAFLGCATARITYYTDPEFAQRQYSSVAVLFFQRDLELRATVEQGVSSCLKEKGINAVSASSFYPPTKAFSAEEFRALVKKEGIVSILMISDAQSVAQQHVVYGAYGGSSYYTYDAAASADVYDVETQKRAWTASIKGRGGNGPSIVQEMISSLCSDLVVSGTLGP